MKKQQLSYLGSAGGDVYLKPPRRLGGRDGSRILLLLLQEPAGEVLGESLLNLERLAELARVVRAHDALQTHRVVLEDDADVGGVVGRAAAPVTVHLHDSRSYDTIRYEMLF